MSSLHPDVWIGLDHLRFGMDQGYGSACWFKLWIRALRFDPQPLTILQEFHGAVPSYLKILTPGVGKVRVRRCVEDLDLHFLQKSL